MLELWTILLIYQYQIFKKYKVKVDETSMNRYKGTV